MYYVADIMKSDRWLHYLTTRPVEGQTSSITYGVLINFGSIMESVSKYSIDC